MSEPFRDESDKEPKYEYHLNEDGIPVLFDRKFIGAVISALFVAIGAALVFGVAPEK